MTPTTTAQVIDAVQTARAAGTRLRLAGGDSRGSTGRVDSADAVLSLARLDRIIAYEPDELVLTAEPGARLAEITALLAARGQHLAFEPFGCSTLGGAIAGNLAGSRRLSAGAVRDHFLGFDAVAGHGGAFRGGGRVVKNVTGFDVPKLLAGSWGTLAALTQVTIKVMPAPAVTATLRIAGLTDAAALALLARALALPADVSGAAHVPGAIPDTLLRLEGFGPSVAARVAMLRDLIGTSAPVTLIEGDAARACWAALALPDLGGESLWRLHVPAASAAALVADLIAQLPIRALYDWGGALVWLGAPAGSAAVVRAAVARHGGHAMLFTGPADAPLFDPAPAPLAALNARVRASFDPAGVFGDRLGVG